MPDIPGHRIVLVERGPFLSPRCDCGWYGPARRSRPLAREEAAAHLAALHPAPTDIPADTPADEGRGSPAGDG
nr:hypothetical protein [Streptomyces aidingensis]